MEKSLSKEQVERIESLNLVCLRKYACAKVNTSNEWYIKCMDCPSIEECRVGKRARLLLEARTSPESRVKIMYNNTSDDEKNSILNILEGCKTPEDIVRKYVKLRGKVPSSSTVFKWYKKYPDLGEKYPLKKLNGMIQACYRGHKGEKNIDILGELLKETDTDEISVDEFLKENEEPTVKEVIDIPENVAIPVEALKPISEKDFMKDRLQEKYDELMKRRGDLLTQISSLNTEIKDVDRMMESVELTAKAFGFSINP